MKINYKKVATIVGSALMIGATAGMAAAASLPSSFTSDLAIVVGSKGVAADSDNTAALNIKTELLTGLATSGAATVTGGDSFKLEKSSTKFHLGDVLNKTYSSLDSDELETFLADGSYDDGKVDTDFTQKIILGDATLDLFADAKYNSKTPTLGFVFGSGDEVLSYVIDFDEAINYTAMEKTYMPLFGKDYYVSETSGNNTIVLLDSAADTIVSEGESVTVNGYSVSIEQIESGYVKFNVDGELTDKLDEGDTYKLDDGSYIALTENLYATKDSGTSRAQFSIGNGKITLKNNTEVTVGDDNTRVKGLYAHMTNNAGDLDKLTFEWKVNNKTFLTESNPITMPQFGALSLAFNGLEFSGEAEKISLDNGETLTLSMGNYDIPILYWDGSAYTNGDEDAPLIIAPKNTTYILNSTSGYTTNNTELVNNTNVLALKEDDRFVVTYIPSDGDLTDVETLYYRVSSITADADGTKDDPMVELVSETDSSKTLVLKDLLETDDHGDVEVKLEGLGKTIADNDTAYVSFNRAGSTAGISYDKVVSKNGLVVTIPTAASAIAENALVTFVEADDDDNINAGATFYANVSSRDDDIIYAKFVAGGNTTAKKETENKNYVAYTNGTDGLSSVITIDESEDAYDYSIEYYGKETPADVQIVAGGSIVQSTGALVVRDTELASVSGKNLIVIGGSCVNSLSASLLGSACGQSFTDATSVKAGQAIIKSFPRDGGKIALLVAGYEGDDTTRAVTYLINNGLDQAELSGKGLIVKSATEATAIVA